MPRRRLHGKTQKRRKKPQTRLLKRKTSSAPVNVTLQPAPFERSAKVERDDLEFLEAMRELQVQRGPWRGDSPTRRQAVERVQFLAEDEERAEFLRSMAHLGVRHLPGDAAAAAPAAPPPPPPAAPHAAAPAPPPTLRTTAGPAPQPAQSAGSSAAPTTDAPRPVAPAEPTRFEVGGDGRAGNALMDALLREGDFAPELKFAGAAASPRRARGERGPEPAEAIEPDSELDLHGKTLEEAIRMVQNFLLVTHRQRMRHVLIITGQGRNSGAAGPVLKDAVFRWLDLNGQRTVRSFARAPARLGGEGAIWVELR